MCIRDRDITVYAYEITTFILNQAIKNISVSATWSDTGVDVTNHVSICFEDTFADLLTSFVAPVSYTHLDVYKRQYMHIPYNNSICQDE